MNGLTQRNLRLGWLVLGLWGGFAGCQSVTQQKAAWSFPPLWEKEDDRPIVTVEHQTLPPLPMDYERYLKTQSNLESPASETVPEPSTAKSPVDQALARASFVSTAAEMPKPLAKPIFMPVPTMAGNGADANPNFPEAPQLITSPPEPPVTNPVAMNARQTQRIVKDIVGATDEVFRTGLSDAIPSDEDPLPMPSETKRSLAPPQPIRPVPSSISSGSVALAFNETNQKTARQPLETHQPDRSDMSVEKIPQSLKLSIPKAAVCRSVHGRGHFEALPGYMWRPGSTVLVYWEMDGLTREPARKSASFAAVVELLATDRDAILASVRETGESIGEASAEGDFAALRWTIPADIPAGEYRIRVTATDNLTKAAATTTVNLPLSRGLAANGFVLP
jgi:hypothetical protein